LSRGPSVFWGCDRADAQSSRQHRSGPCRKPIGGCGQAADAICPETCHQPVRGRARRRAEQGSAQRGAGARLRDATVEPIKGASYGADPMRVSGVRSQRVPLPPLDAPHFSGDVTQGGRVGALSRGPSVFWGCDRADAQSSRQHRSGPCRKPIGGCGQAADTICPETCHQPGRGRARRRTPSPHPFPFSRGEKGRLEPPLSAWERGRG